MAAAIGAISIFVVLIVALVVFVEMLTEKHGYHEWKPPDPDCKYCKGSGKMPLDGNLLIDCPCTDDWRN